MDVALYLTSVISLGIAAQWLAWRLHLPAILLLLVIGFLLLPVISLFHDTPIRAEELIASEVLLPVVSIAVALILFEGGLSLRLSELRGTGHALFRLVTIAVAVTFLLATIAAKFLFEMEWRVAALLGAILTVSGPTVVGPLLRFVRPVARIGSLAKWEGIVNDPVGAVLAVLVFEAIRIQATSGVSDAALNTILGLFKTAAVGSITGVVAGLILVELLKRYLIPDHLQNAAFLATVVAAFSISNYMSHESGLVTVTVLGVLLANQRIVSIKHVIEFKENLRVLLISVLFILLSSRLEFAEITQIGWNGVVFLLLLFSIRPIAVFLSTLGTDLRHAEIGFLAWLHPRGIVAAAVASLFALELEHLAEHHSALENVANQAARLTPITFIVIVGSVAVYGLTISPWARWLGVAEAHRRGIMFAGAESFIRQIAKALQNEGCQVLLVDTNQRNIATARMEGLPTCYASILSEHVQEELDLGAIGSLLAMTPNDEVNSLACQEFADVFSRANVYQLIPLTGNDEHPRKISPLLRARLLFGNEINSTVLQTRTATGSNVKNTRLTDEFGYREFRELYGKSAIVMFIFEPSGNFTICTTDMTLDPQPGQTLISLVDQVADSTA